MVNNFPIQSLINLVDIWKTNIMEKKFTFLEFALFLSIVCILGPIGGVLEGLLAIELLFHALWEIIFCTDTVLNKDRKGRICDLKPRNHGKSLFILVYYY